MTRISELSLELLNASKDGNIPLCIELTDKIKKIMDTYKKAC